MLSDPCLVRCHDCKVCRQTGTTRRQWLSRQVRDTTDADATLLKVTLPNARSLPHCQFLTGLLPAFRSSLEVEDM